MGSYSCNTASRVCSPHNRNQCFFTSRANFFGKIMEKIIFLSEYGYKRQNSTNVVVFFASPNQYMKLKLKKWSLANTLPLCCSIDGWLATQCTRLFFLHIHSSSIRRMHAVKFIHVIDRRIRRTVWKHSCQRDAASSATVSNKLRINWKCVC